MSGGSWRAELKKAFRLSPRRFGRPPFGYRSGGRLSRKAREMAHPIVSVDVKKKPALYFAVKVAYPPGGPTINLST
jgi:hypothetical protein